MIDRAENTKKHLIDYLPAIYREDPAGTKFFASFLSAFERLLLDVAIDDHFVEVDIEPLEKRIADLHLIFSPQHTPEEFLPWLAGWAALTFRAELNSARRRRLLSHIVPLYRIRGTRKYLEELLTLCLDTTCSVSDTELPALQVGLHSSVG